MEIDDFYAKCLKDLKSRPIWTESWLPILDQYVFYMDQADKLMKEITDESVDIQHTNKASHTNRATNPKWRMFLELTKSASALARDLQLNPASLKMDNSKPGKRPKALEVKMGKVA